MKKRSKDVYQFIFLAVLIAGILLLFLILGSIIWLIVSETGFKFLSDETSSEATLLEPAPTAGKSLSSDTTTIEGETALSSMADAFSVMDILEGEEVPQNDPLDLAMRFMGVSNPTVQVAESSSTKGNGSLEDFWILDIDENVYRQISAKLVYQTSHLYFWAEEGVDYDYDEIVELTDTFEYQIYPTDRELFGSEWTPGVDNDEHLAIVYAHNLGSAAGYFSGTDSLMPDVKRYSNVSEMFYLSADYTDLDSSFTYGVLAHEFQHMIHWNQDRNETTWLNEGLSELAVDVNGFDVGGFDSLFAYNPDLQLTFWPGDEQGNSSPHYGASYLFTKYLLSQFGSQTIKEVVEDQRDGMMSLDEVLADKVDTETEDADVHPADLAFQNWTIANFLQDGDFQDGLYGYGVDENLPAFYLGDEIDPDSDWVESTVNQYGTDYIGLDCTGDFSVEIVGNSTVNLLPVSPYSGDHYFWSNSGDESHMRLSHEFDFEDVSAPISLNYWTWYDVEGDYDYVYLTASTDGEHWDILHPSACTAENPTGANYGCGYNGKSESWIEESIDLSDYAGQKVTLQFEYITDSSVNGEGFVLDDISIQAIGYFSDFEEDDGGWKAEGFVRISNLLPQSFSIALIETGGETQVEKWISRSGLDQTIQVLDKNNQNDFTLAISGLTRFTHIPASYKIKITRLD